MGLIENKKVQILRKFTKLVLSVSVFSILVSQSYSISILHSLDFYFHTLPFRLLSHNIDKNFMFLLCNGLLVFLAKYSSSSKHDLVEDHSFKSFEDHVEIQHFDDSMVMESDSMVMESELEKESCSVMEGTEKEHVVEVVAENGEEEEEEEEEGEEEEEEEEEQEEEEEEEQEEEEEEQEEEQEEQEEQEQEDLEEEEEEDLNKKFDEFIRKMKEELRIEARQQLIMV